jgi:hypothetical protein
MSKNVYTNIGTKIRARRRNAHGSVRSESRARLRSPTKILEVAMPLH